MNLGAAGDSFGYRLFFLLHIIAIVVAFAPAFVVPVLQSRYKRAGEAIPPQLMRMFSANGMQIHGPALVLIGVFGMAMVGMSNDLFTFSQTWVSIALALWLLIMVVVFGGIIPGERKAAAGDTAVESRVAALGGVVHLLFLLMVIDMVWKPGV
ncbi:MAG: hypothetical protein HYX34_14800 [Actinobacteria bacterium]|nr:hypothetical protein [Actinomycetota bacterium]